MPPPSTHESYLKNLKQWVKDHPISLDDELRQYATVFAVMQSLNLDAARPLLESCYSDRTCGSKRRDPIVLLRILLVSLLISQPSINKLVPFLRGQPLLRMLCGLGPDDTVPGVGTFYAFLHRLHDGRGGTVPGVERASDIERNLSRAKQPAPSERKREHSKKGKKNGKKEAQTQEEDVRTAKEIVALVMKTPDEANPDDLVDRMQRLLTFVAVKPSAERGLLGDTSKLVVGGDGSALPTGSKGIGLRTCACPKFSKCTCDRIYSDPMARMGWDSHRKGYYNGYRFYELSTTVNKHDLPLSLTIAPANRTDFTEGVRTIDRFRRHLRDHFTGWRIDIMTLDGGHDATPIYEYLSHYEMKAVIPLTGSIPATMPGRPDVKLSKRGIPLCEAGAEMGPWGSCGKHRMNYICALNTGLSRCPLAPEGNPDWRCRPELKRGPTTILRGDKHPRLAPEIHRQSKQFAELRRRRSGTERSNGLKKGLYRLLDARHRRQSFWLIRLNLIAILQHAKVWVSEQNVVEEVEKFFEISLSKKAA